MKIEKDTVLDVIAHAILIAAVLVALTFLIIGLVHGSKAAQDLAALFGGIAAILLFIWALIRVLTKWEDR